MVRKRFRINLSDSPVFEDKFTRHFTAFSKDLLWGSLPQMSPQLPPDSGESGGPVSEELNLQLLLQTAEQLQGGDDSAAGRSLPGD